MGNETPIKDFYGRVLGWIETKSNGDKVARNFYRQVVGTYDAKVNVTKDFYGRMVSKGDSLSALIYSNQR